MDQILKKRLLQSGIALLSIFALGTAGYYYITDMAYDLFTCFYMTVLTVTTIGFDEIIDVKNFEGGRPFTVFIAFSGIGLLTYFVSTVAAIIIDGNLRENYKKRKMEKSISGCKEHYVICGAGTHALHIIEEINKTQRECIVIEINPDAVKTMLESFPDQKYITGDATHEDILNKANLKNANGLFATTNDDNKNLVITLLARRINPGLRIISLCINHDNEYKIKIAGADVVISPNYMGGIRMASEMLRPVVTHFLDIMLSDAYKNLRMEEININNEKVGKKIGQLKLEDYKDTLFVALKSGDELIFKPKDDYEIKNGDLLLIITTPEERIRLVNE